MGSGPSEVDQDVESSFSDVSDGDSDLSEIGESTAGVDGKDLQAVEAILCDQVWADTEAEQEPGLGVCDSLVDLEYSFQRASPW